MAACEGWASWKAATIGRRTNVRRIDVAERKREGWTLMRADNVQGQSYIDSDLDRRRRALQDQWARARKLAAVAGLAGKPQAEKRAESLARELRRVESDMRERKEL